MVLYIMSLLFPEDCVMVMINKYFYDTYFAEPDVSASKAEINGPHWSAVRFFAEFVMLTYPDGNVDPARVNSLIETVFPDLKPFLKRQRPCRGHDLLPRPVKINFKKFGDVMDFEV